MRQSPCGEKSTSSFLEETDKSITHLNSIGEMQRESMQTSATARMGGICFLWGGGCGGWLREKAVFQLDRKRKEQSYWLEYCRQLS